MAIYIPCLGERPDHTCRCGQPATTEYQIGWHPGDPQGGQYEEFCGPCAVEWESDVDRPAETVA